MPRASQAARPFACPICQKGFTCKKSKAAHVLVVHKNSGRFKCSHCEKTLESEFHMKIHERLHTEKKFKCPTCGMGFGIEGTLRIHLFVHSTKKPFKCELCPSRFPSKDRLNTHHLDCHLEKKVKCKACGMRFGRKCALRKHLQCHSNERFECDLCGVSYKQKHNLKRHQASHHSTTHPKTSAPRCSARGKDQEENRVEVEQPNRSDGVVRRTDRLRTRGKPPNYREYEDDVESDESNESRSSGNSESDYQDSDDELSDPDETTRGDDLLEEEQNGHWASGNEWSPNKTNADPDNQTADAYKPPESNSVCSANLEVVFGVEYRAPD